MPTYIRHSVHICKGAICMRFGMWSSLGMWFRLSLLVLYEKMLGKIGGLPNKTHFLFPNAKP